MACPADTPTSIESPAPARSALLAVGACLLLYAGALAWLARRTASKSIDVETAAIWLVLFSIPAGLVYLFGLRPVTRKRQFWDFAAKTTLVPIIIVGVALRAIVMISPPSLEDDSFRYLWDGAVTAHGLNPYDYSPTQVLWGSIGAESVPPAFVQLADEAGPILEGVNHPQLTTIYPPIAQLAFAAAHVIAPWSTDSWRLVLLLADGTTLVILLRLLSLLGLPSAAVALYWWNPILLRETYGGAHMDVLTLPFVTGAVLLATKKRFTLSMLVLTLAGGIKLWPIILVPILLRPLFSTPKRLYPALVVFVATTALVWSPAVPSAFGRDSGFLAYAAGWENNAGAFRLLEGFCQRVLALTSGDNLHWAQPMTRSAVGACLLAWIAWQTWKPISDDRDVPRRCCWVVAALFLLSPTQFPWYYLWLLPLLAVSPNLPLLTYSALLPLYYVRDWHSTIVWLEHGLVWLLLIRRRRKPKAWASGVGDHGSGTTDPWPLAPDTWSLTPPRLASRWHQGPIGSHLQPELT